MREVSRRNLTWDAYFEESKKWNQASGASAIMALAVYNSNGEADA